MMNSQRMWILFLCLVINFRYCYCYFTIAQCVVNSIHLFMPYSSKNQQCNTQMELVRQNLIKSVPWAVNLKDASAGSIQGLLSGITFHPGLYDQCINTHDPSTGLQGQYCVMTIQVDLGEIMRTSPTQVIHELHSSINDPIRVRRDIFHVGVCIPNGCSHEDITSSFTSTLQSNILCSGLTINVTVPAPQCTVSHPFQWDLPKMVFCSTLAILCLLVAASTFLELLYGRRSDGKSLSELNNQVAVDLNYSKIERFSHSMLGFSVIYNTRTLAKEDSATLAMVNVVKVVFMVVVVFGHRFLTLVYIQHPVHNMEHAEKSYTNLNYALLHSGSLVNDIFLSISGFLTAYSLLKSGQCYSGHQLLSFVWRKIYRLYPGYLFTIGFTTFILADVGDGPFWNMKILSLVEECRRNWWSNVLFVNNFVHESDMCLMSSWYIATSVQLMLGLILAIYLARRWPRLANILLFGSFVFFGSLLFFIIFVNGQPPVMHFTIKNLRNPAHMAMYTQRYIKSYTRAIPYILGVITANLTIYLKREQVKMTSMIAGIWFLLSLILGLGVCYGTFSMLLCSYTPLESAIYGTMITILFSLAGTGLYVTHVNSVGFGPFDSIIRSRVWTVLSRLSFWVHLLNVPLQQMMRASRRTPDEFFGIKLIWETCGDVIFLYVFSLMLYLTVEAPIICICQNLFRQNKVRNFCRKDAHLIPRNSHKMDENVKSKHD